MHPCCEVCGHMAGWGVALGTGDLLAARARGVTFGARVAAGTATRRRPW